MVQSARVLLFTAWPNGRTPTRRKPASAKNREGTNALPANFTTFPEAMSFRELLLEREHHQTATFGVGLQEVGVVQGPNTAAARTVHDRHVLLAVGGVGGGVAVDAAARLERPQVLAGL